MTHLGEHITDFVFGELSAAEMEEARQHLSACGDCRTQVEQFEQTRSLLKTSPDVEPPRRIVFEIETARAGNFWRWLAPLGAAAAILIAVLIVAPPHIQWNASQLTVVFGAAPPAPVVTQPAPVVQTVVAEQVDYDRILKRLEQELDKHDAAQLKKIQRLQDQWAYVDAEKKEFERSALRAIAESGVQ